MSKLFTILGMAAALSLNAQEQGPDRLKIPLRDPSRPASVKVNLVQGSVTVKGYSGSEILVEANPRGSRTESAPTSGPRRINIRNTSLTAEEENNAVSITTDSHRHAVDLIIQVPTRTSLKLSTVNSGGIRVEGVDGEIEVNAINGGVTLTSVSGTVVAHSLNGPLTASLKRADAGKPMSFTTLNGKVDVTLPSSIKADLKVNAGNGDVYSDFDVELTPSAPVVENSSNSKGRYRVRTSNTATGKLNGGGQEITFKTLNGTIHIRKAN